jgi:beta-lactamase superfamily II metal-dependent hydrolase
VRWPCPTFSSGWDANDNSLVLDLVFGARRFLFAGDAEAHAEGALLAMNLGTVDVLKVAHHGSRTSSGLPFLSAMHPEIALVSAGRNNRYGHPHPEVWDRIVAESCCALRTDRDGGVVVTTDGRDLDLTARRCNPRCRAER